MACDPHIAKKSSTATWRGGEGCGGVAGRATGRRPWDIQDGERVSVHLSRSASWSQQRARTEDAKKKARCIHRRPSAACRRVSDAIWSGQINQENRSRNRPKAAARGRRRRHRHRRHRHIERGCFGGSGARSSGIERRESALPFERSSYASICTYIQSICSL